MEKLICSRCKGEVVADRHDVPVPMMRFICQSCGAGRLLPLEHQPITYTQIEMEDPHPTKETPSVGDYVLATKYDDGDPCDHFFVGFVTGYTAHTPPRFMIADGDGVNQRGNGFGRAERITQEEGDQLVAMMPSIGDKPGPSVWYHLQCIRGMKGKPNEHIPEDYKTALELGLPYTVQACNSYHRREALLEKALAALLRCRDSIHTREGFADEFSHSLDDYMASLEAELKGGE